MKQNVNKCSTAFTLPIECKNRKISKFLGVILLFLIALLLFLLTLASFFFEPYKFDEGLKNILPLWWLLALLAIPPILVGSPDFIVYEKGLCIYILGNETFIAWEDVNKVTKHRYYAIIESDKLPHLSHMSISLRFNLHRKFTIDWTRNNYALSLEFMEQKLGTKFKQVS